MLRFLSSVLVFLTLPSVGQAKEPVSLLDYGVICDVEMNGQIDAPDTASGVLNLVDQTRKLDITTALVPAELGLSFGLRTQVGAESDLQGARMVVTHPPMGATGVTRQSWAAPMGSGETGVNLFSFETKDELVQGEWRFQLVFADQILLEQVFEVLPKGAVPAVQQICHGVSLTS